MRWLGWFFLVVCLSLPAAASGQASGDVKVTLDPAVAGKPSRLSVVASGQATSSGQESPKSVSLLITRGFKIDPLSRAERCSADQAKSFACPPGSKVATGSASGQVTVPPFPPFDFTATAEAFLTPNVQPGDIAGVVVQVREPKSGRQASIQGRLLTVAGDATFGDELRFENFDSMQQALPPGASARLDRLELSVEAHRTVRRTRTVKRRVRTPHGRTRVVRRRKVSVKRYDLITNPRTCTGSWPYQVRVTFPSSQMVRDGSVPCSSSR